MEVTLTQMAAKEVKKVEEAAAEAARAGVWKEHWDFQQMRTKQK